MANVIRLGKKRYSLDICKRFVFLSLIFRLSYAEMDVKL